MDVFWVVAIALIMEAASTSETSVTFYQTTQRSNPEYSHLQRFIGSDHIRFFLFFFKSISGSEILNSGRDKHSRTFRAF
jgi:hypothetical protein